MQTMRLLANASSDTVLRPCICHFKSAWLNKGKKDFSHPRRIFICQILIHYVVLFMFSDLRKRILFQ